MIDNSIVEKCKKAAWQIRRDIIDMTFSTGNTGAHIGGSLSMVEILASLYCGCMKYHVTDPQWEGRDRLILSKGHAALALYPALVQAGIISREELLTFKHDGSRLSAHPSLNGLPGIEFASGSLGQGLSLGVGTCLALQRKNNSISRVFVILGDGECDEGSVWEAIESAAQFHLNRLIAIIDNNAIQYDGFTKDILNLTPLDKKFQDFGWDVSVVDGHDIGMLLQALNTNNGKPLAIIANTIKGKGISFIENDWRFHNARLTKEQYDQAVEELEKSR